MLRPDHATEKQALHDIQSGLQSFDMRLLLERRTQRDIILTPVELFGVTKAAFTDGRWTFQIDDRQTVECIRDR